jgi:excisionase family DNA binding protein
VATEVSKVTKLAVKSKEAAEMLSISERVLSDLASSREIASVKVGRAVIYDVRELERWLTVKTEQGRFASDEQ